MAPKITNLALSNHDLSPKTYNLALTATKLIVGTSNITSDVFKKAKLKALVVKLETLGAELGSSWR